MNRPRRHRYRAAGALSLAIAMGLLAAVGALAGIAVAKDGGHRLEKRHGQHHRHHHHQPSGTIQSFDTETGRLTIALLNEETVSGLVTDRTRIRCEDEHAPDVTAGTGANCTTSDLIVGTVVTDAELEIEHGGATWDEVELAG